MSKTANELQKEREEFIKNEYFQKFQQALSEFKYAESREQAIQNDLGCKHELTEMDEHCVTFCLECSEILSEGVFIIDPNSYSHYKKRSTAHHCTKKYFEKHMEKLSITNYDLVSAFEEQEHVLKQVLKHEDRKNSLNVNYKLYKLSQTLEVSYKNIKLPKGPEVRKNHDRIMKRVWDKLEWNWIET